MKKNYFTLLLLILAFQVFRAQTTETFESFTGSGSVKPTTFTSNSQPFTLTTTDCVNGGTFGIFIPGQTWNKCSSGTISNGTGAYGVGTSCTSGNCTGTSNKFVENGAATGTSQIYSIKTTNSALFTVKALHVYASTDQGNTPAASGVIFRGKKAGVVIFTVTKSSGMNTSFGTNNGFTYIDFSTEGGSNNTGYTIDELEVQGTGAVNYIAIDNFVWAAAVALSATTSQSNVSCNGGSNGMASVTASGGSSPYTYAWSPSGGTGSTASGLAAGNYTCTITDASSSVLTKTFSITQPPALAAVTSQTNVSCNGGSNGIAKVTALGGTTPYTYAWSPSGGTAATASGLAAGSYTCTITDANSCSITKAFAITQPSAITAVTSQTNISCNGGSNGMANVSASGGTSPYTYAWSPSGGTAATASGLSAGNYTCTITDANNCSITKAFGITQPTAITAVTSQTNISCNGGSNGSAKVTPSGGTSPYTYVWAPSGGTAATASGLAAGSYTCTITDANSCSITKAFGITQPAALTAGTGQTNVSCNGASNGVASVGASGGTSPYTYAWSPSGGTGSIASGLAAGNYTCTITDNNSCSISKTFTLTQPTAITAVTSQTNISCNGGSNGVASVSASGGTIPYTYAWSPSGGTAATASGLAAGNYTCTITDANSCTSTKVFSITQPAAITAVTSQTNVSCNGGSNGSAKVTPAGGTSPYTYAWAPSGGTAATASGLAAGSYTCTITDANSCSITKAFGITQPTAITAVTTQTNVSCNGGSNGVASVSASGGTAPYTYAWSPSGGTGSTASGLAAGSYTCTITDNNSCSITKIYTLTQPAGITAVTTQTNVSCNGGSNGAANVNASGGASPYSYAWAPSGGTGATASGLAAGSYTCTITDNNSCTTTKTFNLTQPAALTSVMTQTNVSCHNGSNGVANVSASGGTAPYTYAWSPSGGTGATASGLTAGNYTCTITDNNGCSATGTVTISQPTALTATGWASNVSCHGGSNGWASFNGLGGTAPYSYIWTPGGTTSNTVTGLSVGTYTCSITDNNGCSTIRIVNITEPAVLTATSSQTNVSCNGGSNGAASVSASGGTGPYTYSWTPGSSTSAAVSGLTAGNYTCTVTDNNGCTSPQMFVITQPMAISAAVTQTNVSCNGGSNGVANVSVSGGTTPYTYAWAPTGGTGSTASGLAAGSYTCMITDNNGCTANQTASISEPSVLTAVTSQTNVTCNSGSNGIAVASVTGGTAPYTYTWMPGSAGSATVTGLSAGNYTCYISDNNACSITGTVTITAPAAITHTQNAAICQGQSFSVGSSTYTAAGTYTDVLVAANSCDSTVTTILAVNALPTLTATASSTAVCAGNSTTLTATGANTYTWTNGVSNGMAYTPTTTATYTVNGTDANGCIGQASITVTVNNQPAVTASATSTMVCQGQQTTLNGGGANTYTWTNGISNGVAYTPTATATYTVSGTDVNGCTGQASITVTMNTLPAVTASATSTMVCQGQQTTLSGGGANTYTWTNGVSNGVAYTPTATATYTVSGTDLNGCHNTATISITVSTCTGIDGQTAGDRSIIIYPNPFSSSATIRIDGYTSLASMHIELYDHTGRLVKYQVLENSQTELSRGELSHGLYFYSILDGENVIAKGKLVIE